MPHFDVLDPRSAADLLREAQAEVLASNSAEIQSALGRLAVLLGETTLAEGLAALREDRLRLGALITGQGVEPLIARIEDALGLAAGADALEVRRAACSDPEIDRRALLDAARILAAGTGNEAGARPDHRGLADRRGRPAAADLGRLRDGLSDQGAEAEADRLDRQQGVRRRRPRCGGGPGRRAGKAPGLGRAREGGDDRRAHRGPAPGRGSGAECLRPAQARARSPRLRRPDRRQPAAPGPARDRVLGAVQARSADRSPAGRRGPGHEPRAMGDHPGAERGVLRRRRGAADPAHAVRGRRREAVDHERPGRRRRDLPALPRGPGSARPRRPPALAGRAARPLVPLGQADPGPGRRGVRRPGRARRRGQRP